MIYCAFSRSTPVRQIINQILLRGEVFFSQCKVLIDQREAVSRNLAHQVGRHPEEEQYQHPVKQPQVVIHRLRSMENTFGDLLGLNPPGPSPPLVLWVRYGPYPARTGRRQYYPEALLRCKQLL